MLDIAWQELFLIGAVALIVIGPKDLPKALHTMGRWVRKLRHMSRDLQNNFDELMREAELAELKDKADAIRRVNIGSEIDKLVDPGGSLSTEFKTASDAELLGDLEAVKANPPPAELPAPEAAPESLPEPLPATLPPVGPDPLAGAPAEPDRVERAAPAAEKV